MTRLASCATASRPHRRRQRGDPERGAPPGAMGGGHLATALLPRWRRRIFSFGARRMAAFACPRRSNRHAPGSKREDAASPTRQQCCREMATPHGLRRGAALAIAALASPMRSGCCRATGEPRPAASAALMCAPAGWHLATRPYPCACQGRPNAFRPRTKCGRPS